MKSAVQTSKEKSGMANEAETAAKAKEEDQKREEATGSQTQKAPSKPPEPAGEGDQPEVSRAGPSENQADGSVRITNRSGKPIRVIAEQNRGEGVGWQRDSVVNIAADDYTAILVQEGRRIVIDTV